MTAPEAASVARIAAGDRGAFEELFAAYHRRVFGYVFRMIGDAPRAEEVTSDVLFEVWKGASRFAGRSRVSTWIFGIAHHKVIDAMRRRAAEPAREELPAALADPGEQPDAGLVRETTRRRLRDALDRLTVEHREVVELAFFEEYSVAEIAAIVRCPANTVKTRLFHARKRLRDVLGAMGAKGGLA